MYVLFAESCHKKGEERCFQVDASDKAELWHHRCGHLIYKGLHTLTNKEMVTSLPEIEPAKLTCETCMKAKQHRVPFQKQST